MGVAEREGGKSLPALAQFYPPFAFFDVSGMYTYKAEVAVNHLNRAKQTSSVNAIVSPMGSKIWPPPL